MFVLLLLQEGSERDGRSRRRWTTSLSSSLDRSGLTKRTAYIRHMPCVFVPSGGCGTAAAGVAAGGRRQCGKGFRAGLCRGRQQAGEKLVLTTSPDTRDVWRRPPGISRGWQPACA